MNERERAEQLDQFIDRLLAGKPPALDEITDPELGELYSLAKAVRALRTPAVQAIDFAAMAARVAQALQPGIQRATDGEPRRPAGAPESHVPEGAGEPDFAPSTAWRRPTRGVRLAAELLAAAIVLGLFTGLLIALLSGRAEPEPAGSPTVTPMPAASPTPLGQREPPGTPVSPPYQLPGPARTDGDYAVWVVPADPELTRFEIQAVRLTEGEVVAVASVLAHPGRLDIDRGVVVWDEADPSCPTGCPSVHARNLATGETLAVADSEGGIHDEAPAISGSSVVWLRIDPNTGYQAIMARDIARMAEPVALTERTSAQLELGPPVIDGEWVAWAEGDDDAPQHPLMLVRIGAGRPEVVATDVRPLSYDIGGGVLVSIERSSVQGAEGSAVVETLVARRLDTGETTVVRGPLPDGRFHSSAPATDGRYVFWAEYVAGERPVIRIWGHDLATRRTFAVTGQGISTDPQAAGGWLVWTYRPAPNAGARIYAARVEEIITRSGQP